MKRIIPILLFLILAACAPPQPEPSAVDAVPGAPAEQQLDPWLFVIPQTFICASGFGDPPCPGTTQHIPLPNLLPLPVPAQYQGLTCNVMVETENDSSVHIGNDLLMCSNDQSGSCIRVYGVEDQPGAIHFGDGPITLGEFVDFWVEMGEDGVWSAALDFTLTCDGLEPTPTATATSTDVPPTETPTNTPPSTSTSTPVATSTATAVPTNTPTGTLPPSATPTEPAGSPTPTSTSTSTPPPGSSPTPTLPPNPSVTPTEPPTAIPPVCTRMDLELGAQQVTGTPEDGTYIVRDYVTGSEVWRWEAQAGWLDSGWAYFETHHAGPFWVYVQFAPAGGGPIIVLNIVNPPPDAPSTAAWLQSGICHAIEVEFP